MSYDLWLSKVNQEKATLRAMQEWFSARSHFTLQGDDKSQAFYENEDTGVYFWFELDEPIETSNDIEVSIDIFLGLNFARPNFFALEAAIEIEVFCEKFDLTSCNPQEEETVFLPFDAAKFTDNYKLHNQMATERLMTEYNIDLYHFSDKKLDSIWYWNYSIEKKYAEINEDIFIPRIFIVQENDCLYPVFIWTDAIPTLIPSVNHILINREKFSPLNSFFRKGDPAHNLISSEYFKDIFSTDFAPTKYGKRILMPIYQKPSSKLKKIFKEYPHEDTDITIIPFDKLIGHK